MNSLENIISKTNLQILRCLSGQNFYLRDLARKCNCSPAKVLQALRVFEEFNFIYYKKDLNKKIISLNKANSVLSNVRRLDNLFLLTGSKSYKKLSKLGKLGVFGSFAEGTDRADSDIDFWFYGKDLPIKTKEARRQLEKELGKEVNLIHLTKAKVDNYKTSDAEFYNRLKFTSIFLNCNRGDIFD